MRYASLILKIPGNWIGSLTSSCDLTVKVLKCVPKNSSGGKSLLKIDSAPELTQDELAERIISAEPKCTVHLTSAGPGRHIGSVELENCLACQLVSEAGCFLDSASSRQDGRIQWNVIAPNNAALKELIDRVEKSGCTVEMKKISMMKTESELTVAQERVLELAFREGYFDIPRGISLEKLANSLEISKATLDVMLRRGQRKLIANHVEGMR